MSLPFSQFCWRGNFNRMNNSSPSRTIFYGNQCWEREPFTARNYVLKDIFKMTHEKVGFLERPSCRSFQVASCHEGVYCSNWREAAEELSKGKRKETAQQFIDKRHTCAHIPSPGALALKQASRPTNLSVTANNPVQENNHRRRWTPYTLCWREWNSWLQLLITQ